MSEQPGPVQIAEFEPADVAEDRVPAALVEKIGPFASLRIPNFRFQLAGGVLSNAGQWIQQVTLSWLVYDLTGSGTILGSINLVRAVAALGMIAVAGLLVDRLNRRVLITIENACLFLVSLAIGLLLITGHSSLWYLFILAFVGGLIQTVDQTLRQVLIFDLVPRKFAPNAMALLQTGWSLMRVIGPSIGGFLILWFGPGGNFLIQAGAYVLVAVTILQIHFPAQKMDIPHTSLLQNFREGLAYVVRDRHTRTFTLMGIVMPLLTIPIFSVLPVVYAVEVFGDKTGSVLGLLMAAVGVGGIIGGVVSASLSRVEHWGRVQLASLFLMCAALIAFAFTTYLPLALVLMVLAGFFELVFIAINQTMLQLSIPDNLRGRVSSVLNLSVALSPVGGMLAGGGSDLFGGPRIITAILAGIAAIIAIVVFVVSPTVRDYRLSRGLASHSPGRD
jgi:MFS transporter, DHA1 family, staphyloferrin A biosynthesis exporter